jgi:hypothetical protein
MNARNAKGVTVRLAPFALTGALATIAAAWAASVVHDRLDDSTYLIDTARIGWPWRVPASWPRDCTPEWRDLSPGAEACSFVEPFQEPPEAPRLSPSQVRFRVHRFRAGWPFYALGSISGHGADGGTFENGRIRIWQGHIVPARPLLGFALDTAFYGTLAFLLWSAPAAIRRRTRRARGRCPACGYDLKDNTAPICPECGA